MVNYFDVILAAIGLGFGSFMNVLLFRYNPDKNFFGLTTIGGRSHCMQCGRTLRWFELIPLFSFLFQLGRCRNCHARLSLQYPVVECIVAWMCVGLMHFLSSFYSVGLTAIAFFTAPVWFYGVFLIWFFVFFLLFAIVIIDFRYYIIPNEINAVLGVLGIGLTALLATHSAQIPAFHNSFLLQYSFIFPAFQGVLLNHILGMAVGVLFFGALSIFSGGRAMGLGDAKLAFGAGLLLGWPDMGVAMLLSFIVGGISGVVSMILRKKGLKDRLPFGPFFVCGWMLTMFFGAWLMAGYFHFFSLV